MMRFFSPLVLSFLLSLNSAHAESAFECRLFNKLFSGGTAFTAKTWDQLGSGGGGRLISNPKLSEEVDLAGLDVIVKEVPETESQKELVLHATKDKIKFDAKNIQSLIGKTITLGKMFQPDALIWKGAQKQSLFKSVQFADWLTAAEDKSAALYHVPLKGQRSYQNAILEGALPQLQISKGVRLKIKALDPPDNPTKATLTIAKDVELAFGDLSNLAFSFGFPVSLEMIAPELAAGSLDVLDAKRSIQGTRLNLALTHSNVDFPSASFRGCIGFIDQREPEKGTQPEIAWLPIDNVTVERATSGNAQVSFFIEDLPNCLDNAPKCEGKLKDPYAPRAEKTFLELFLGGQENVIIKVWAADAGNGVIYLGSTEYLISGRSAAFLISILAFVIGYFVIVGLRYRKNKNAGNEPEFWSCETLCVLSLVRGHNGTASLSNLQIFWWTLAVFSLMIFSWVATGSLISLNDTIIWLLGIGGAGSLAARVVAINNQENNAALAEMRKDGDTVQPAFWDLISVNGRLDLTKLQMLLFTGIAGVYIVTSVWEQVVFPELQTELLTLMGLSNGLYVLGKVTASNPYQKVGNLLQEKSLVAAEIAKLTAEKEVLEGKISKLKEEAKSDGTTDVKLQAIKEELLALNKRQAEVEVELKEQQQRKVRLEKDIAAAKEEIKN